MKYMQILCFLIFPLCFSPFAHAHSTAGKIRVALEKERLEVDNLAYFMRVCGCIDISVKKHGSRHIFVVGHDDCAGNPLKRSEQEQQLRIVVSRIHGVYQNCQVTALYVDDQWQCTEVEL